MPMSSRAKSLFAIVPERSTSRMLACVLVPEFHRINVSPHSPTVDEVKPAGPGADTVDQASNLRRHGVAGRPGGKPVVERILGVRDHRHGLRPYGRVAIDGSVGNQHSTLRPEVWSPYEAATG